MRSGFNESSSILNTQNLEKFGKLITYFPESLEDVELPAHYKYPLPELFLDRIGESVFNRFQVGYTTNVLKKVKVYGTDDRKTIILISKRKLKDVINEIAEDEKNIQSNITNLDDIIYLYFYADTELQSRLKEIKQMIKIYYSKYKEIFEMYGNIEIKINDRFEIIIKNINTKYIDYEVLSILPNSNLIFENDLFNEDLSLFTNSLQLIIKSDSFNQPISKSVSINPSYPLDSSFQTQIPKFDKLLYLYISSSTFDQPIYELPVLLELVINAKKFNQDIPELKSLINLVIHSDVFDKNISRMNNLKKLFIDSPQYNKTIIQGNEIHKFDKLECIMIISNIYNVEITPQIILLPKLKKLRILSPVFDQQVPMSRPELIINVEKKARNQETFEAILNDYIDYDT